MEEGRVAEMATARPSGTGSAARVVLPAALWGWRPPAAVYMSQGNATAAVLAVEGHVAERWWCLCLVERHTVTDMGWVPARSARGHATGGMPGYSTNFVQLVLLQLLSPCT